MPFVRKTDSQGTQPLTDTRKLFIGRTGELLFFVQNLLKPDEPTHNIISIWGQGGVGTSTLLARFMNSFVNQNFVLAVQIVFLLNTLTWEPHQSKW